MHPARGGGRLLPDDPGTPVGEGSTTTGSQPASGTEEPGPNSKGGVGGGKGHLPEL